MEYFGLSLGYSSRGAGKRLGADQRQRDCNESTTSQTNVQFDRSTRCLQSE